MFADRSVQDNPVRTGKGRRFGLSTRWRLALVICLITILPLLIGSVLLMRFFEGKIVQEREARLVALARHLSRGVQEVVPEATRWDAGISDWQALHNRIAPLTESMVAEYDDTIVGFYSAKLNAFAAYSPESHYQQLLGAPLPKHHKGYQIYETKQSLLTHTVTMAGEGLLYAYPIMADDRVVGHTFAIITQAQLNRTFKAVRVAVGAGMLVLSLLVVVVSSEFSRYLTREVNRLVSGLRQGATVGDELVTQIPELHPLITEMEQATDTMLKERQRNFALLDALPLGLVACDPEHRISFLNETAAEIMGVSIHDSIGLHCLDFVAQTRLVDHEQVRLFNEVASGQRDAGYELLHYRDAEGNQWPMHALILPISDTMTDEQGLLAVFFDLRKEVGFERLQDLFDQEMRKSQVILETLTLGVIATNHAGLLTTCNRAGGVMLGIDSTTAMGQPLAILPEPIGAVLRGAITSQKVEKHVPLAIGQRELIVDIASLPAQGGAVAVLADVTLWNKMQRDAQRTDRLALIGEMAAGTAHEIRNPLTALRGFLQLLQQRLRTNPDLDLELEWIELMLGEADQINHVVNEFLQLARNRDRKVSLTSPAKAVQAIFPVIENDCRLRDMTATLVVDPDLPPIEADVEQMKQVVLNLARNGLEAMQKDGVISLAVRHDPVVNQITISVTDQGCGIPAVDLKRIFNPFYTTRETGTGLGLAICQRIVEDHRGRITVTSEVGAGSTFTVWLPVAVKEEGARNRVART